MSELQSSNSQHHAFETARFDAVTEQGGMATERRDTTVNTILNVDAPTVEQADAFAKANYSLYSEAHADLADSKQTFEAAMQAMATDNAISYERDDRGIEGGEASRQKNEIAIGKLAIDHLNATTFATMNADESLTAGREFYAQHKDVLHEAAIRDAQERGVQLNLPATPESDQK